MNTINFNQYLIISLNFPVQKSLKILNSLSFRSKEQAKFSITRIFLKHSQDKWRYNLNQNLKTLHLNILKFSISSFQMFQRFFFSTIKIFDGKTRFQETMGPAFLHRVSSFLRTQLEKERKRERESNRFSRPTASSFFPRIFTDPVLRAIHVSLHFAWTDIPANFFSSTRGSLLRNTPTRRV